LFNGKEPKMRKIILWVSVLLSLSLSKEFLEVLEYSIIWMYLFPHILDWWQIVAVESYWKNRNLH